LTSSEPPGYAPRGVYLITPALHNATASTGSAAECEDTGSTEGEEGVGGKGAVKIVLITRKRDRPAANPINKEITVLVHLLVEIISIRCFCIRTSDSKAIIYKRKKLLI
jgi:hypothetical protein